MYTKYIHIDTYYVYIHTYIYTFEDLLTRKNSIAIKDVRAKKTVIEDFLIQQKQT